MSKYPPDIDAVIFDLDGLLLDTESLSRMAWKRAAEEHGYVIDDALHFRMVGRPWPDNEKLLREMLGAECPLPGIRSAWLEYYLASMEEQGIALKPGLFELLEYIEGAGIPRAIATASGYDAARHKLRVAGVDSRFDIVIGGDQVPRSKPFPDIYLAAASRLNVEPARCLVLEDSEAGARAAHAAGMVLVIIPDLGHPPADVTSLAYRLCASLHEVVDILEQGRWRR